MIELNHLQSDFIIAANLCFSSPNENLSVTDRVNITGSDFGVSKGQSWRSSYFDRCVILTREDSI
jgi:hypothetical protein